MFVNRLRIEIEIFDKWTVAHIFAKKNFVAETSVKCKWRVCSFERKWEFWGKYSENSDLTRLVGRHSFGGWKTDALHKQTFQKVNKNRTSFHTRCLRTTGRWVATAIFCQENQLRMQCCVSCLSKRKLDGSLQI